MSKREFLQKAHILDFTKHGVGGKKWSVKLNGKRCFWDGGVSRGYRKEEVPWANTDKDSRFKSIQIATGLWSQNGNIVHAPEYFLDGLPLIPLDGELYAQGLALGDIMSIVTPHEPDNYEWQQIGLHCFDMPALETIFATGVITNKHFQKIISWDECSEFIGKYVFQKKMRPEFPFWKTYWFMERLLLDNQFAILVPQQDLPMAQKYAKNFLKNELDMITDDGGEGIVVRHPDFPYQCERSYRVLKMKKYKDMEGTVIGYSSGRIGIEGRLLGLMGNVKLRLDNGVEFEISGFRQAERELIGEQDSLTAHWWAHRNPDTVCPDWVSSALFPRGSEITFRYRDLTKDGVPVEAHYHRLREPE